MEGGEAIVENPIKSDISTVVHERCVLRRLCMQLRLQQ